MRRSLIALLLLAGCGSHKDECERLLDRAAEVSAAMSERPRADPAKDLAECRAHIDEIRRNPQAQCVLAASTTDEAKACVAGVLQSQRAKAIADRKAVTEPIDAVGQLWEQVADAQKQIDSLAALATDPDVRAKLEQLRAHRKQLEAEIVEAKRAVAP